MLDECKVYIDDYTLRPRTAASNFTFVSKAQLEIEFQEKIIYTHMGSKILLSLVTLLEVVFLSGSNVVSWYFLILIEKLA